jgi:hypothetical protein
MSLGQELNERRPMFKRSTSWLSGLKSWTGAALFLSVMLGSMPVVHASEVHVLFANSSIGNLAEGGTSYSRTSRPRRQ